MTLIVDFYRMEDGSTPEGQAVNRKRLAQDVANIPLVDAGTYDELWNRLDEDQRHAISVCLGRLFPNEQLGTVELYTNRAMNVYLRKYDPQDLHYEGEHVVDGFWTIRTA